MDCPKCGAHCGRDEVHNGVAMIYGPWGCGCGWSEDEEYDLTKRAEIADVRGGVTDQFGNYHPPGSNGAEFYRRTGSDGWAQYAAFLRACQR